VPAGGEAAGGTGDLDLEAGVDRLVLQLAPVEPGGGGLAHRNKSRANRRAVSGEEAVRPFGGPPRRAAGRLWRRPETRTLLSIRSKRTCACQCTETEFYDAPKPVDRDPTEPVVEVERLVRAEPLADRAG
jgi:hypothetical protein